MSTTRTLDEQRAELKADYARAKAALAQVDDGDHLAMHTLLLTVVTLELRILNLNLLTLVSGSTVEVRRRAAGVSHSGEVN